MKKIFLFAVIFAVVSVFGFAEGTVEFKWKLKGEDQNYSVNGLPQEIVDLINQNMDKIVDAFEAYEVREKDIADAEKTGTFSALTDFYEKQKNELGREYTPLTTTTNGLNDFSGGLSKTISNTQFCQNIWSEAWIGNFVPIKPKGFHIGAGLDVGASQVSLKSLKNVAEALGIDGLGEFPDDLVFPTIATDMRIGGIVLPFDFGFNVLSFDTTKISALDDLISPVVFDFFTLGFDARYAILKGSKWVPKISAGLGYTYTKGGVNIKSDDANASVNFESSMFYLQTQVSKKLLFFIPFIGAKVGFANSTVDWNVEAQWDKIFNLDNAFVSTSLAGEKVNILDLNIIPKKFEGSGGGFVCLPQFYAGFAFDIVIFDLTFSVGYDVANQIASGAFSMRFSW